MWRLEGGGSFPDESYLLALVGRILPEDFVEDDVALGDHKNAEFCDSQQNKMYGEFVVETHVAVVVSIGLE